MRRSTTLEPNKSLRPEDLTAALKASGRPVPEVMT